MSTRLDFYQQTYAALYEPVIAMSRKGIRVDRERMEQRYQEICDELALLRRKLLKMAGHELFGKAGSLSTDRAAVFFYETLGCAPIYKVKKGKKPKLTVDEIAVRKIRSRNLSRPRVVRACDYILRFRWLDARKKFYRPSVVDRDGRFRASYHFTPPTLRFSSSKNPMGTGHNGQNMPRDARDHFLPDKGHVFMPLDLSQAESRVVYMLTGEPELIRLARLPPWEYDDHQAIADLIEDILVTEGIVGDDDGDPKAVAKKKRYFGKQTNHGCVDGKTEVLTNTGWVSVAKVDPYARIAVWQETGGVHFETPKRWNKYRVQTSMYHFEEQALDQFLTPNHRVPYTTGAGIRVATPLTLPKSARLPRTGYFSGERHNPDWLRWLVAVQADAHIRRDTKRVIFHFKKQRKIRRAKQLMQRLGIAWDESSRCKDGSTYLYTHALCPKEFRSGKRWGSWLLEYDALSLDAFLAELPKWDGSVGAGNRQIYLSKQKNNVDWVHTLLHLRGKSGVLFRQERVWGVSINRRQLARCPNPKLFYHSGSVYCPTVSTGFFLMRRNGKISVTGNSNYGETGIAMSKFILKQGVVVAPDTCQRMINAKMKARPAILDVFQRGIRRKIMDEQRLTNPFGHELNFAYARPESKTFRQGYMFIPQTIPPTLINQYGWLPFEAAKIKWRWDARVANQIHDELLFSVNPADAWDVMCFMRESLERPVWYPDLTHKETARPMTIPVSVKIGSNGGNLYEFDRPPTKKAFMEVVRAAAAGEAFH